MTDEVDNTFKNIILFLVNGPSVVLGLILVYFISKSIIHWFTTGEKPPLVEYVMYVMKQTFVIISRPLLQLFKLINYVIPLPNLKAWYNNGVYEWVGGGAWELRMRFVSFLILVLFTYLTVSLIFIFNGTPAALKIYSDTIFYGLFIVGIVLGIGGFTYYSNKSYAPEGIGPGSSWIFDESKPNLIKAVVAGLVVGILSFIAMYFMKDITTVNVIYMSIVLSAVGLMFFMYSMLQENKVFQGILENNIILKLLYNAVFILPCIIFETAKLLYVQLKHTPGVVYVGLFIELVIVTMYIILPLLKNHLYVMLPTREDKLSAMDEDISIREIEIQNLKNKNSTLQSFKPTNGYALNENSWNKMKKGNLGESYKIKILISNGYNGPDTCKNQTNACVKPLEEMLEYITKNLDTILTNEARIDKLTDEIKKLKEDRDNMGNLQNGIIIQNKPVYLNKETIPDNNKLIPNNSDYKFNYTLSCWFFLTPKSGEHGEWYNKYATILDYNKKPKISYNNAKSKLKIEMNCGGKDDKMCVKEFILDIPLQKWNNLVINYDGGVVDLFVNGVLKNSFNNILPTLSYDSIRLGQYDGISGGICNVVYYPMRISQERIELNYNLLKNNNPPTI
jgi:hypothetical protein